MTLLDHQRCSAGRCLVLLCLAPAAFGCDTWAPERQDNPWDPASTFDFDHDGVPDNQDADPRNPDLRHDQDSDGVDDAVDNCIDVANADQEDVDVDAVGDACDDCIDHDHDGFGTDGPAGTCLGADCDDTDDAIVSLSCGDHFTCGDEVCDDGVNDGGEGECLPGCVGLQVCGDGIPEGTEFCDDGFTDGCGTCNADCTGAGTGPGACGDGNLCPETEACDDGFNDACGTCNVDCTGVGGGPGTCGDGDWCRETEICDDGFQDDCGDCNATCTDVGVGLGTCGDNHVCGDETCDDGANEGGENECLPGCQGLQVCGDDVAQGTEACDEGTANGTISTTQAYCTPTCTGTQLCGNDLTEGSETCDEGADNGTISTTTEYCEPDCSGKQLCGDSSTDGSEQCDDGNSIDWDGCTACAVTEFRVNTETASDQYWSSVAMASDNSFVVVWTSDGGQDGEGKGIFGQRYASDGLPLGAEFRVNTETAMNQWGPAVAVGADDRFIVAWSTYSAAPGDIIVAQRYDPAANRVGGELTITTQTDVGQGISLDFAADGSFVVVWGSIGNDDVDNSSGVYGQRFASNGMAVGPQFLVNTTTLGFQGHPDIAVADDGRFVVAWTGDRGGVGDDVYARRFGSDGTPAADEFRVNTYMEFHQTSPSVATALDGSFVVAWWGRGPLDDGNNVYGQRYGSDGTPVGVEFEANTSTTGDQLGAEVAMAVDGRFVIGWVSNYPTQNFFAQQFSADGNAVGAELQMNGWSSANVSNDMLRLGMGSDGRWVATWNTYDQDGDGLGVFGARFDAAGVPLAPGQ